MGNDRKVSYSKLRHQYITFLRIEYHQVDKHRKKLILDQLCRDWGYHRKSAVRAMNAPPRVNKRGRKKQYSKMACWHLRKLWLLMDQMGSKKMVAAFPDWLEFYEASGWEESVRRELLSMSAATIDRALKPFKAEHGRKLRTGTKPGMMIKSIIPLKPLGFKVTEPGFVESDTVAHCGNSMSGDFIWSITFVDIHLGWTEAGAIWNKGRYGVITELKDMEERVPFDLRGFYTDNGSEFLNHALIAYFLERYKQTQKPMHFNRGRPYKKNDQCHVEQKNWTHVRQLFGYERFDNPELIPLMNDLYKNYWSPLQNFFVPQVKLIEKKRIGSKYKKKYSKPMTPYHRALACPSIDDECKEKLKAQYQKLNPFELRKEIEKRLKKIFQMARSTEKLLTKAA